MTYTPQEIKWDHVVTDRQREAIEAERSGGVLVLGFSRDLSARTIEIDYRLPDGTHRTVKYGPNAGVLFDSARRPRPKKPRTRTVKTDERDERGLGVYDRDGQLRGLRLG